MKRADLETTYPISREVLLSLLAATKPSEQQSRKRGRPASQLSALLPPCPLPRGTRPPPLRAQTLTLQVATCEQTAAQVIAEAPEKLDRAEQPGALREKIAMLPTDVRLRLAEVNAPEPTAHLATWARRSLARSLIARFVAVLLTALSAAALLLG